VQIFVTSCYFDNYIVVKNQTLVSWQRKEQLHRRINTNTVNMNMAVVFNNSGSSSH